MSCKCDSIYRNVLGFEQRDLPQDCELKMEYKILSQKGLDDEPTKTEKGV